MIYKMLKQKIEKGTYEREDLLKKMDVYLLKDRISEEEYSELCALMNA